MTSYQKDVETQHCNININLICNIKTKFNRDSSSIHDEYRLKKKKKHIMANLNYFNILDKIICLLLSAKTCFFHSLGFHSFPCFTELIITFVWTCTDVNEQ